jgi:hypothetical protein
MGCVAKFFFYYLEYHSLVGFYPATVMTFSFVDNVHGFGHLPHLRHTFIGFHAAQLFRQLVGHDAVVMCAH